MSTAKKIPVSVLLLAAVVGGMFLGTRTPSPLVQRYLGRELTCRDSEPLTIKIWSQDSGRSVFIDSEENATVKLRFKEGSMFGEEFANDTGQRLQIYDGNLDLVQTFGHALLTCDTE